MDEGSPNTTNYLCFNIQLHSDENCNIFSDSVSTLKTFIFTLTHKAIFEFTNVNHSVINHNTIRVSGRYTTLDLIQNKSKYLQAGLSFNMLFQKL